MKKTIAAMILLAGGMFAAPAVRVGVGFSFGSPAPVVMAARPACPGPGYTWVNGYQATNGFVAGYWAAPAPVVVERTAPRVDYRQDNRQADRHFVDHRYDNRGNDNQRFDRR